MANAYSILHNYDRPLYTPNYELIATAMQYKQGKLDANRARLQTVADQIGFADVAKQQDKDYIENRLQSAVDIANKYAALDLSSSSLTNQLIGKVTEVVDDNVKNAVLSTKVYRSEQAEWAKKQEEEPDLYSEDNYQYAMRGANAWLNDEKVGTKYNGGGGFIAYDNYGKRVQDNIINIAKQLEAEWVIQEDGSGMFIDNVTKKAVDRGRLEAAIDAVIGDSGRQQMSRESWNRSRFVDEEALKSQYEGLISPKMEEAERYVVNLKAMISRETNPEKKKELQTSLDNWTNIKNTMASQTLDGVDKADIYYRIHSNDFKSSYLDAYSYDPITIKREVDQNSVKTTEFKEKVRQFELEYSLKEKEFQLKEKEFGLKEKKAMFDMGIDPQTGLPIDNKGIIPGTTPEEFGLFGAGSGAYPSETFATDKFREQISSSIQGLNEQLGGNLSEADLLAIAEQVTEADIAKGGKKVVTRLDGKTVTIDFDNKNTRDAYIKFKTNVVESSQELTEVYEGIGSVKKNLLDNYLSLLKNGELEKFQNLPNYSYVVKNVNGKLKVVQSAKGTNDFARIVQSIHDKGGGVEGYNKLSKEDKASLDIYLYNRMVEDNGTDTRTGTFIKEKMRRDLVEVVGWDGLNGNFTDTRNFGNWGTFSINSGYLYEKVRGTTGSPSEILGSKYAADLEVVKRTAEESIKSSDFYPRVQTFIVTKDSPKAKALKSAIGKSTNKNDIQLTTEVDDEGNPTGAFYYSYYEYDESSKQHKLVVNKDNKISKETATALGLNVTAFKADYDASSSGAPTFNLGGVGSAYSGAKDRAQTKYGTLAMDDATVLENTLNIAYEQGGESLYNTVSDEIRSYHGMMPSGNYIPTLAEMSGFAEDAGESIFDLKLRPRDGQYYLDLEKRGKTVYSTPFGSSSFTAAELSDFMYDEAHYFKSATFNMYLNSMIGGSAAQTAIKQSEDNIRRMLNNR